ncbi:unnamed protein product [Schistocephalus solidus]|uniref:Secreted protein n=1 Tax=Schistocephalus solidus TaxID=70667 RepID=A0A183THN4_SCHSO|nr:unnamed protein product [Schistocephalus solidus]
MSAVLCKQRYVCCGNMILLLSFIVSSLDVFLLLEARFSLLDLLLEEQSACAIEERSDAYILDAGLVERNYLLAKCNLIGGPTERYLPPRTLCCVRRFRILLFPYSISGLLGL